MKHYLSLGAGVQSSTLALMAARGEVGPMPDAAIFADTHAEPKAVYEWLDYLSPLLPFPVRRVTAGDLRKAALTPHVSKKGVVYYRTAIPFHTLCSRFKRGRITHRTCTRDFKLVPIFRLVRAEVGPAAMRAWRKRHADELREWKYYQAYLKAARASRKAGREPPPGVPFPRAAWDAMQADALACQWIGISLDEMARAKPSRDPWLACRWPLIERRMTRAACLEWLRSRGYPEPPRSACVFCPFRSNREWRHLKTTDPDGFAAAVAFDAEARRIRAGTNLKSTPYVHRSCKPLGEVDLRNDTDLGQLTLWDDECTGMCGV